ncbi:MAG: response regulator, partial [Desulfosalsimonas sp.]
INMPKQDGFDVLKEMKSNPDLAHIPVVMLTTSERDEDVIRSYEHGACSFIRKPVSFDKLREAMHNFTLYWTLVARIPGKK